MDFLVEIARGCMPFLYFLRDIANPFLDVVFAIITHLGEETVFLVLAIFIFWCVNKREGYYVLIVGLVGTVLNQFLKLFFRVPRPWKLDPDFKIVKSAEAEAGGYSFPSGHTQNIAGTFGSIAAFNRKRWLTVSCIVIILLVAFSRMYLGVHTPLDVGVSLIIALFLIIGLHPLFETDERFEKALPFIVIGSTAISSALLIYASVLLTDPSYDTEMVRGTLENGSTLFGCTLGLILVYFIDTKFVRFKTEGKWYAQIIKLVVGVIGVYAIKEGLEMPFELLFGNKYVARAARYFLVVGFSGAVWPLTFKKFSTLTIPPLDRFSEKVKGFFNKKKENNQI